MRVPGSAPLERKVAAGLAVALVLIVLMGAFSISRSRQVVAAGRWVEHTHRVIQELRTVLSIVEADAARQRGFLLTGDVAFLEGAEDPSRLLDARIERLRSLTADNPSQQRRLAALASTVRARIAFSKRSVDVRRREGFDAAQRAIGRREGDELLWRVQDSVMAMEGVESDLLAARAREREASQAAARTTLFALMAVTLMLFAGVYVVARRETGRRNLAEKRLADANAKLQGILDGATEVAIIAGDPEVAITLFNKGAEKMLGYSATEIVGVAKPQIFHLPSEMAEHAARIEVELGKHVEGGRVFVERARLTGHDEGEWTYVRKDGSHLLVDLSVTPLKDPEGRVTEYLGIARDVTERRRAEKALREKNEELRAFAYTVSHDLKAPLRGISGYAQELERKHRAGLTERGLFCVGQITIASRNLDHLIDDLLRYSRLDAETPTPAEVDALAVIETILRERSLLLQERGVEVAVDVQFSRLRTWDRGFHQVMANIIDNALKYSRDSHPPRLAVRGEETAELWRLEVEDNGIGFDMKYHDRIFGLFNRLVRPEEFDGTGAGLAIVRKILDKAGGTIRAVSEPGRGATFIVELKKQEGGRA